MQNVVIDKPYRFLSPHRGDVLPWFIQSFRLVDWYLRKYEGIVSHEVRGVEHLRESLRAGHGVLLAPNHCRYADPIAMGWVAREADVYIYTMASWHLFHESRFQAVAMRICGGFSVYREGPDRQSLNMAIELMTEAKRPLVVFPEGTVFRTNDALQPLLDGVAFLARAAARSRDKRDGGRVVIHPVAIKYLYRGEVARVLEPVLATLERRLTLSPPDAGLSLVERTRRLCLALLTLQEIRCLGEPQSGPATERQTRLVSHLLAPLEQQWLGGERPGQILTRVKALRTAMVPQLLDAVTTDSQRQRLWEQFADIYIAQQIASHPVDYLDHPTDTRLLETVERIEEDLTDRAGIHPPLHAILEVAPAIEIGTDRPPRGQDDPIMVQLTTSLRQMLERLSTEAQPIVENSRATDNL